MNYLYLILNLGSLFIPFIFSFHPKLKFYNLWKPLFLSIIITMCIFIPWDIIFTNNGIWGFNAAYFLEYRFFNLPIEEWLFFICIPYACVFTHYSLLYYFPKMQISLKTTRVLCIVLISVLLVISLFNFNRWYTFINFAYAIILLIITLKANIKLLQNYFLTFLIILIPFFIVNGILTGSFIENEVVWYNNSENLNIRLFTIPIEDTIYAFTLVLTNLVLLEYFQKKLFKK